MTQRIVSDNRRPWSWPQFSVALGLIPVSCLVWIFGMGAVGDPHPEALLTMIRTACLIASPFIGIAGGLWLAVLLVRRFFWTAKET